MKNEPAKSVDAYLAAQPEDAREALERVRRVIHDVVPTVTEAISYQMPMFRYEGRDLLAIAAFTNHCSLFALSSDFREANKEALAPFGGTGKGTVHFTAAKPLPVALLKKIIRSRLADAKALGPKKRPST